MKLFSLDFESAEEQVSLEPWHDLTPDQLFEKQWAIQILERAFANLEQIAAKQGKSDLFDVVAPYLAGSDDRPGYQSVAEKLGATPSLIKMSVSRWRSELRRLIRAEIRATVTGETEVEDELRRLSGALAR